MKILVVEDDEFERGFLEKQTREMGYDFMQAGHGRDALDVLRNQKNQVDVVLMDRRMPVMDGLTAVRQMKDDPELRKIPVVMLTGGTEQEEMRDCLAAGVFYYLNKPVNPQVLRAVLTAATREAQQSRTLGEELKKHKASFNLIQTCKFHIRTLEEAECLAAFIAHCFPNPERVVQGLAELLVNAIEHGNLGIGYERKSQLLGTGTWRAEIERRQESDEYRDRLVEVMIARKDEGIYAVITDQGKGFDWKRYITIDPARAGDNHGRGIAQARSISFDKLTYNEIGNQAVAFVGEQKQLEW